jgi:hypothetical protein
VFLFVSIRVHSRFPLRLCATPASRREALRAGSLREIFLCLAGSFACFNQMIGGTEFVPNLLLNSASKNSFRLA